MSALRLKADMLSTHHQSRIGFRTSSMPLVQLIAHVDTPVSSLKALRRGKSLPSLRGVENEHKAA